MKRNKCNTKYIYVEDDCDCPYYWTEDEDDRPCGAIEYVRTDVVAEMKDHLTAEIEKMRNWLMIVWNFPSHPGCHPHDMSDEAMCPDDWRHGWICAVSAMHEALRGEGGE